jgi:hypothetical protein
MKIAIFVYFIDKAIAYLEISKTLTPQAVDHIIRNDNVAFP